MKAGHLIKQSNKQPPVESGATAKKTSDVQICISIHIFCVYIYAITSQSFALHSMHSMHYAI